MTLVELIRRRRTVHDFHSQLVPKDTLLEALDLALWAPNHRLTIPWAFYDFFVGEKEQLATWALEIKAKKKPQLLTDSQLAIAERRNFLEMPHLFCVLQKKSEDAAVAKEDYASLSAGLQNMSLYLWELGIGTKWSTGAVTRDPRVYSLMGLESSAYESAGFLSIGFPRRVPPAVPRQLKEVRPQFFTSERSQDR